MKPSSPNPTGHAKTRFVSRLRLITTLAASTSVMLVLACGSPQQIEYERAIEQAPPPEQHAIHDERLRQIMQGLDRLAKQRLPKELDVESNRDFQVGEVSKAAEAMAESATLLRQSRTAQELDPNQRRIFDALADKLRTRALALSRDVSTLSIPHIHRRLAGIEEVCESCHTRFRIE